MPEMDEKFLKLHFKVTEQFFHSKARKRPESHR